MASEIQLSLYSSKIVDKIELLRTVSNTGICCSSGKAGTVCLSICLSIYLSMALQSFVGPWPLFQFLDLFTESVGLLGRVIGPLQGRYLHTCL
jgi:hypothetical protein